MTVFLFVYNYLKIKIIMFYAMLEWASLLFLNRHISTVAQDGQTKCRLQIGAILCAFGGQVVFSSLFQREDEVSGLQSHTPTHRSFKREVLTHSIWT